MEERKTPEDRAKLSDLDRLRHSAAHVMAAAIARLWPDAQFAGGPAVEDGFYYDVELAHRISPEDFPQIEAEMKKEIKANHVFEKIPVTREQALQDAQNGRLGALGDRPGQPSKFKIGNLHDIPEGEPITYFKSGDFLDLCAGPHVMRTGNIGSYKLTSVASAYYKGDEKNPQLQRIYGVAFKNRTQLDEWLKMQEEARKRDHRKIGAEMGLYVIDTEYVGPGLPLWLPKGAVLCEELEKLAKEAEFAAGYVRVKTPHLAKEKLYKTSGHLPYYAESMFPPMVVEEKSVDQHSRDLIDQVKEELYRRSAAEIMPDREELRAKPFQDVLRILNERLQQSPGDKRRELSEFLLTEHLSELYMTLINQPDRYYLKAMNCPHHHRIYAAEPKSYRDLPLRLAEYGCCYRYEQSGELFGLMRVRSMNMNDAHIYCPPEQFAAEFNAVNEMYLKNFKVFGLEKYVMRFSTHGKEGLGKKYVNEPELWKQTEDMVREVLKSSGINFVEVANEAAFYGPKIDVQVWSAIGREFTIATNQVDFAQPRRFDLKYRDKDNTDKTPLCIHRAPLGTHERFIGFLIEHYAGNFPLWLAPEQVRVLTIGDEAAVVDYARAIVNELHANMVRVAGDYGTDKINGKIQEAERARVHTMLVIGPRDVQAGAVSIRLHGQGQAGVKPKAEAIVGILQAIRERQP